MVVNRIHSSLAEVSHHPAIECTPGFVFPLFIHNFPIICSHFYKTNYSFSPEAVMFFIIITGHGNHPSPGQIGRVEQLRGCSIPHLQDIFLFEPSSKNSITHICICSFEGDVVIPCLLPRKSSKCSYTDQGDLQGPSTYWTNLSSLNSQTC